MNKQKVIFIYKSKPDEVENAVKYGVEIGYRHIDCAWAYQNETEVGNGLAKVFQDGKVKREDLFVVTKVHNVLISSF